MIDAVEFISAGAGSGKTYALTQTLASALEAGEARPHAVLATTFTVRAAAELRERVRARLLEQGLLQLSVDIGQARVGTVNSICGQLLERFCFERGQSPDQTVLSEERADGLLARVLDETMEGSEQADVVLLGERLSIDEKAWRKTIKGIVDAARANGIGAEALRGMGAANADRMLANWPAPDTRTALSEELRGALTKAALALDAKVTGLHATGARVTKVLSDGLHAVREMLLSLEAGSLPWTQWMKAGELSAGAETQEILQPVKEVAARYPSHPAFHEDVRAYLGSVFGVAAGALEAYRQAKVEMGAVDFVDQESQLLETIRGSAHVREALGEELDLVLVDEFQDTSPLQLALFVELARLARRSVWVGDPKQAIYGFRGTDAGLVAGVLRAIPQWGGTISARLSTSRRSTPSLVELSNAVFGQAFLPEIAPEEVRLETSRSDIEGQPALMNWEFEAGKEEEAYHGLGQAVSELLSRGLRIVDKDSGEPRALRPGDIGVLCRTNDEIDLAVQSLERWGVPSASPRAGLLRTAEATLVIACLRRLHDAHDTVASALVWTMCDGVPPEVWLADRLAFIGGGDANDAGAKHRWKTHGEQAHPLLALLETLRPRILGLTPAQAMRLVATHSQVGRLTARWAASPHEARSRLANVEALLRLGQAFEDECTASRTAATLGGLLRWLDARAEAAKDERAGTSSDAASVLTYHAAKGLEWPVVVLNSLDDASRSSLWGVRAITQGQLDPANPLGRRFVHCWIKVWGAKRTKLPEQVEAAEASEVGREMAGQALAENARLLYVGLTRARDLNILVTLRTKKGELRRAWVDEIPDAGRLLFGETGVFPVPKPGGTHIVMRESKAWDAQQCALAPKAAAARSVHWFSLPALGNGEPARPLWRRPSAERDLGAAASVVLATETVSEAITVSRSVEPVVLGQALHACIARAEVLGRADPTEIGRILGAWGVDGALDAQGVVSRIEAFRAWRESKWPGCRVRVEVPIEADGPQGTRIRGSIDLLIDTPDGWVLIDHKASWGEGVAGQDLGTGLAQIYGPQLALYGYSLWDTSSRPTTSFWLHLPLLGKLIRLGIHGDLQCFPSSGSSGRRHFHSGTSMP
jgi:ATP-dependent helicase/nuclease subunit A